MLTPGEVTQTLSNTLAQPCTNRNSQRVHHSKINLTTEVRNLEFLKFSKVHTNFFSFQNHLFCLRDIAYSTRFTRSSDWLPSKKKHQNFLAPPKLAKLVNSIQHDSVYYQQ
ncbi:hypothetical protein QL285_033827 [Trifolium repens]|nr:hypothetical protein QL285_033827 [Trifolium repens]